MSDTDQRKEKSPLNVALGRALQEIREQQGWRPERLPQALGLSASYFRAIELGSRYLPSECSVGLTQTLDASFPAVSALLSILGFLDARLRSNPLRCDHREIRRRAEMVQVTAPHLSPLMTWVIKAIDLQEKGDSVDGLLADGIGLLRAELSRKVNLSSAASNAKHEYDRLGAYPLSPVYALLIDSLADHMTLFPPQMGVAGFKKWELQYSEKITRVYSYVRDVQNLLEDASRFDWGVLGNKHDPIITILIPPDAPRSPGELKDRLAKILRRQFQDRSPLHRQSILDRIVVLTSGRFDDACQDALLFDLATRRMPMLGTAMPPREMRGNPRYGGFKNAWVYQIAGNLMEHERLVGFLGTHVGDDPAAVFVGVMDRDQVRHCWDLFSEVEAQTSRNAARAQAREHRKSQ